MLYFLTILSRRARVLLGGSSTIRVKTKLILILLLLRCDFGVPLSAHRVLLASLGVLNVVGGPVIAESASSESSEWTDSFLFRFFLQVGKGSGEEEIGISMKSILLKEYTGLVGVVFFVIACVVLTSLG
jgi:hypothetical protein